ncbi:hypothetical protein [Tepidicaulis sp.]|uniref:hypothetical protein n=1 Tax=Tepidicaulis sp. TaxID=1920809 RepID=UPI003B59A548
MMITPPPAQNPTAYNRTAATGLGLALYLYTARRFEAPAPAELAFFIRALCLLTAFEVSLVAGLAALYFDTGEERARRPALLTAALWTGGVFACNWLVSAFVRAGTEAYVAFGLPPLYGPVM